MQLSQKIGRWVRIAAILAIVAGGALIVQAATADAPIPMLAYIAVAVGIVGIILARRSGKGEPETQA